ncbi:hypothetical protein AGDE_13181 [Angomonas deanei]|nr:hypothetical protein AGDE_13181 [Angomonas deanei]|eukprot:EPY22578.1 hypothetical protein AGDE_13181 [Angomonas deanei]
MPDIRNGSLLMVGYAFLRRLTKGKLFVNSLVCTLSGSQAMPYKEVLDRASIPRVRLFQGPLQGPSRTVGCISYGKVDTSTRMMTTVLSQIGKVKVASSVRSVNDFITENEESLKRTAKRLSGTSLDSGEKVTLTTKADRIKSLLNDHKGLLSNPQQPLPFYKDEQMNSQASQNSRSRGGKSHSSQNPSRLATVAIVTKGRSGGNNTVEVVDETNIKANGENVPFSEVVARPDNAATIRSVKMDDMTDLSLSAHNTAVLMSETPGSKACLAFASRMVRNILSKMPARSEVFYNIYGQKDDGTVKDFVTGDDYKKRAIMTSPLFGPCFENAPMEVLKSDSALEVALTKAAAECATQDAVCLAVIVFKYISPGDGKEVEDDVSLSSLLIAMDPSGTCGQYEKYLFLEKKQRGIYQCALGGSCQTLGVLGLTEDTDKPALKNALRVFNMLGAIEGTQLRNGSLRRFVDYTQFAINKMKEDLAKLPREEAEKIGKVRIPKVEVMRNDSADLLKNPVGRKPILYAAS